MSLLRFKARMRVIEMKKIANSTVVTMSKGTHRVDLCFDGVYQNNLPPFGSEFEVEISAVEEQR